MSVVWHDLECGAYTADLEVWLELARGCPGPILDVGAGTGRTALALAAAGHRVTALDHDPELLAELARRAAGLPVEVVVGDARELSLDHSFALIVVPMQTIQLLGGRDGRARSLTRAREHLQPGGTLAVALCEHLEPFSVRDGGLGPAPDVCERDGVVYASRPIAVRPQGADGYLLERRRETVTEGGVLRRERNLVRLDRLSARELEREALAAGLRPAGRIEIAPTEDHVGSVVVVLRG